MKCPHCGMNANGVAISVGTQHGTVTGNITTYHDNSASDYRNVEIRFEEIVSEAEKMAQEPIVKQDIRTLQSVMGNLGKGTLDFLSKVVAGVAAHAVNRNLFP